jgi:hypothetical protein
MQQAWLNRLTYVYEYASLLSKGNLLYQSENVSATSEIYPLPMQALHQKNNETVLYCITLSYRPTYCTTLHLVVLYYSLLYRLVLYTR